MGESDTLLNAVVGAVVSLVTSFLPFSPVLGGAVAGYLERGNRRDGAKVGALSGLLYMVPMALFGFLILLFLSVPVVSEGAGFALLFLVPVFGLFVLYTVGLGALGGVIGVYVLEETDLGADRGEPLGHPSAYGSPRKEVGNETWSTERPEDVRRRDSEPESRPDDRDADRGMGARRDDERY